MVEIQIGKQYASILENVPILFFFPVAVERTQIATLSASIHISGHLCTADVVAE